MESNSKAAVVDRPINDDTIELVHNSGIFYRFIKRSFDIIASLLGLVILSPLFLAVMFAIAIEDGGPPLFFQPRIGWDCKSFKMAKFRSMRKDAEALLESLDDEQKQEFAENFKLQNDPRITKVGAFIRKTSIDELPQLWNVLIGDMSLVGPRPPLLVERDAYGPHLKKVMSVRPGITGYWQVHGRSETSFSERIEMNEYYIDNKGILMDIRILFGTVKVVFSGKGAV